MKIVLLDQPEGNVIAREAQFGEYEGEFFLEEGRVYYRHVADERTWLANPDPESFKSCVEAWNRYGVAVNKTAEEAEQLRYVQKLKTDLEDAGAPLDHEECFWAAILEQTEHGLL